MKQQKDDNFQILYEDLTLGSNNALGVGDSGMNLKPEKRQITFFDLIDQADKMKETKPSTSTGPYPIQVNVNDDLADAYVRLADAVQKFYSSINNPVVRDNKPARKVILKMIKKARKAQNIIKSFTEDLSHLEI